MGTGHQPAALLTVDEALGTVLSQVRPLPSERVPLAQAAGRYLAEDLRAPLDLPPFTNSAMDGFAVRAADTPGELRVVGESAAGRPFEGLLGPGQAVTISTGAVIPEGADTIVIIEEAERVTTGHPDGVPTVRIQRAAPLYDCFRDAGSDVPAGELVLTAGTRIGPGQIGAAAALGLKHLSCAHRPSAVVLPTGDELRPPGEPLAYGQIYNSNGPMLQALLQDAGATVATLPAVADTPQAHREAMVAGLEHDLVISSGGVSVGPHDLVRDVGQELGVRELFWRIRLKPGKPLTFGTRERGAALSPTLVYGVPGNPVSTLVCFELFVRPALLGMQGAGDRRPRFERGLLADGVKRNPERDELIRVRCGADGRLTPLRGQQSHQIAVSAQAEGLARIATGTGELPAGSEVAYLPLGR